MPLTLAHPALVLPLRRLAPRWLNFPALVAGSMAPDALYYLGAKQRALTAHEPLSGLWLSLPSALLLLALFYAVRKPIAVLLPQPLRTPCLAACDRAAARFDARGALTFAASLLLGIWSHILWDSFTHPWGWFVRNWGVLNTNYLSLGFYDVHGFKIAQHLSTLIGLLVIALSAVSWARRAAPGVAFALDRARATAWGAIVLASFAAGALSMALNYPSYSGMLFYFITTGTVALVVFSVIAGVVLRKRLSA